MLNIKKAKVMSTECTFSELTVKGKEVKVVDNFVFLGSRINSVLDK